MTRRPPALVAPIPTTVSLREQVARALRTAVFTGDMPPGHTFSVPALAEQFGVSATPAREAVLDLVQQGLVVAVPTKGFRVVDPTPRSIEQTVEIRQLIEVPVMKSITAGIKPAELTSLRRMAERIMRHARRGNLRGFVEVDYEFHYTIMSLHGNELLVELVEDLRSRARIRSVADMAARGHLVDVAREHLELLDAMAARDLQAVERITLTHMSHALGAFASDQVDQPAGRPARARTGDAVPGTGSK